MLTETAEFVEATYRRHIEAVYRFCLWRTNSHHDAEDAATATVVKLLTGRADNVAEERLLGWLISVADNECKMVLRKRRRRGEIALDTWTETAEPDETCPWISPEICAAVNDLRPGQKRVLFLKAVEDLTFKETAGVLGISEGAAKMVFYRTVKRLAKVLETGGKGDG